jgi:hypothetical protein
MDLSVVKDVVAGALVTASVGSILASVGTVAFAPLLMGSNVSVGSVDRVSVAALLMGSVTTITHFPMQPSLQWLHLGPADVSRMSSA